MAGLAGGSEGCGAEGQAGDSKAWQTTSGWMVRTQHVPAGPWVSMCVCVLLAGPCWTRLPHGQP